MLFLILALVLPAVPAVYPRGRGAAVVMIFTLSRWACDVKSGAHVPLVLLSLGACRRLSQA
jgi:hypothetical protein